MYEYDNAIFDGLVVPSGINKDDVINEILMQCAELEVLYPSWTIMKRAISIWSTSNQYKWEKLYNTLTLEYNPIWNVDANITDTETISGTDNRTINRSGTASDNETVNLTDEETRNLTDTKSVKGFNETGWADAEKNVKAGTDNINHTGTDNHAYANSENITDRNVNDTERQYTQRRTGNIGVTMTQQMIEAERQVADFNFIETIVNSFKYRFCILVY